MKKLLLIITLIASFSANAQVVQGIRGEFRDSVTSLTNNTDLVLKGKGTGNVVIQDILDLNGYDIDSIGTLTLERLQATTDTIEVDSVTRFNEDLIMNSSNIGVNIKPQNLLHLYRVSTAPYSIIERNQTGDHYMWGWSVSAAGNLALQYATSATSSADAYTSMIASGDILSFNTTGDLTLQNDLIVDANASGGGSVFGNPTGGAQGAGTINTEGVFINGNGLGALNVTGSPDGAIPRYDVSTGELVLSDSVYVDPETKTLFIEGNGTATGSGSGGITLNGSNISDNGEWPRITFNNIGRTNGYISGINGTSSSSGGMVFYTKDGSGTLEKRIQIENNDIDFYDGSTRRAEFDVLTGDFNITGDMISDESESGSGSVFGNPTGGAQGAGTINAVGVYDDGTLLTDYVFEAEYLGKPLEERWKGYERKSLQEEIEFVKKNYHLSTMIGREEWEKQKASNGELISQLWETVETQFLYIKELEERIQKLESDK